jgi:hypothetical protein
MPNDASAPPLQPRRSSPPLTKAPSPSSTRIEKKTGSLHGIIDPTRQSPMSWLCAYSERSPTVCSLSACREAAVSHRKRHPIAAEGLVPPEPTS